MNIFRNFVAGIATVAALLLAQQLAIGQSPSDDDTSAKAPAAPYADWTMLEDDKPGERMQIMRLKVYPKAAPVPLLRHRLIPDPAERTDGNAAPAYLKAMGFVEQTNARIALHKMQQKWLDEANEQQGPDNEMPRPDSWREMPPESLPLAEVKRYLDLIAFQEPLLFDAARRKNYSQDRAMEREPNPIAYLLPEVQQMRELTRQQIVRLRYAIAQGRIDDAVEIMGQMLAIANHIGQDEFLVSYLVGVAIQGMATTEGLGLSQHPDTPNLYWAIAACPNPLVDISNAIETERLFLIRQFPMFGEVNETVRSKGYWADFVERILPSWNEFTSQMNSWQPTPLPQNLDSFQFATIIATQYEPARRFLNEVCGMSNEQLDKYPTTQIVFLAMVKYHAIATDEATAMFHLPFSDRQKLTQLSVSEQWGPKLGWIAESLEIVTLSAGLQIHQALTRTKQWTALWQTVEALRMTAASNGGKAPTSLDKLVVPAPFDPVTGKPFEYAVNKQTATVTGAVVNNSRYQLIIEIAKPNKEKN